MGTFVSTAVGASSGAASTSACPVILVAAPASGQGKTTLSAALARLHTRQGKRVTVFKCGPDFLDPFWLSLACTPLGASTAAKVHSLDLWMTGEGTCRAYLQAACAQSELVIVEGVMGLFDGEPSAADLAHRLGLPVLTVIDASAMAGTFGALAYGLAHFRPELNCLGVIANRVAGERHADMLRTSLRQPAQWLGALPRQPAFALPERHLGLALASEVADAQARLDRVADALALTPLGQMPLSALGPWVEPAGLPALPAGTAAAPHLRGQRIAVARDAVFCFIYPANLDTLRELGAELVFFSPLADEPLPACDALWLPGGYPELHAAKLAARLQLRDALKDHVAQGKPVWAECGGMMVLFEQLHDTHGVAHALWGLLPGQVKMQERLAGLGPQQLTLGGRSLRGHSFHYSRCETPWPVHTRSARPGVAVLAGQGEALYRCGSLQASYFHAWFASNTEATARLFLPSTEGAA